MRSYLADYISYEIKEWRIDWKQWAAIVTKNDEDYKNKAKKEGNRKLVNWELISLLSSTKKEND